jgi:hypothetical protein
MHKREKLEVVLELMHKTEKLKMMQEDTTHDLEVYNTLLFGNDEHEGRSTQLPDLNAEIVLHLNVHEFALIQNAPNDDI